MTGFAVAGRFHRLNKLARHRPDICPPVAFNFSLISHSPERKAIEVAAQGVRNAPAHGCLADTGRPDQAEDRPCDIALQLADRDELQDSVFDIGKPIVVPVKNRSRFVDVVRHPD